MVNLMVWIAAAAVMLVVILAAVVLTLLQQRQCDETRAVAANCKQLAWQLR